MLPSLLKPGPSSACSSGHAARPRFDCRPVGIFNPEGKPKPSKRRNANRFAGFLVKRDATAWQSRTLALDRQVGIRDCKGNEKQHATRSGKMCDFVMRNGSETVSECRPSAQFFAHQSSRIMHVSWVTLVGMLTGRHCPALSHRPFSSQQALVELLSGRFQIFKQL
jgi:hypothetical protein